VLEFVEMFKAPIKMLHPLLTATQEGNYIGTENIGAIPFTGIILAHSNESEWQSFKNNKNNEAFIDRICVIKVPYCLRVDRRAEDLREADRGLELSQRPARPGRWKCWRASRCSRGCASTRTRRSSPRCASMTARA
jgi:serine protein kinase